MSSLLREEMQRVLFRPAKQRLVEFIEIEEPPQGRHFLCVSVAKNKLVQLSIVQCQVSQTPLKSGSNRSHTQRSSIQECYRRTEIWSLQDLTLVDGRDPDVDDPCFLLHFDKRVTEGLEPIPADTGREAGYTLDWAPVNHRTDT